MRRFLIILAVCGLVLLAFGATAIAKPTARPFQGYLSGTCSFMPGDSSTGMWAHPYGVGQVSHLGASVMTAQHPAAQDFTDGEMTMVAANGDEVWFEYIGSCPLPNYIGQVYDVLVTYTIVGGTGRFADASGGGDMTVTLTFLGFTPPVWPAVWPEVCTWRGGTISY
jgi:hypothetical protein